MLDLLGELFGRTIFFSNMVMCLVASILTFLWMWAQWDEDNPPLQFGLAMVGIGCFGNFATTASLTMEGVYRSVNAWELGVYTGATVVLSERLFGEHIRHWCKRREERKRNA